MVLALETQGIDSRGHGNQPLSLGGPKSWNWGAGGRSKDNSSGFGRRCGPPSQPAVRGMRVELPGRKGHFVSLGCNRYVFPVDEGAGR